MILIGIVLIDGNLLEKFVRPDVILGVGGSLIAAGIAGEVLFLYIRAAEGTAQRLELLVEAGLLKVFSARSVRIREEYETRLKDAKEIDVLGFGLASFRQDYGDKLIQLTSHATIRIIVLDPDFPTPEHSLADLRDAEEKNHPGQIRGDIEKFEKLIAETPGQKRTKFQIRRLRAIPAVNIFRVDDVIFWGPYLIGNHSRNMPTLLVQRGGFLFDRFKTHFDELWSSTQFTIAI
jgi:hypothetical protein